MERQLELLELMPLRKANPYDLSGGEQQRLALGKILLLQPDLLFTGRTYQRSGSVFQRGIGRNFKKLKEQGVTVLMVTHDIEFCAEYADHCAMMFDGDVVSQDTPRNFLGGNSFYTTAANRMSREIFENAVTSTDVVELCKRNMK